MDTNKYTQRLLRALAEERASHGHGAAADIDQQLERSEGYLGRILRGEVGLQVEMLFRILDVLGSDPADFFARVVGTPKVDPERLLARVMRQGATVKDPLLERVEALLGGRFEGQEVASNIDDLQQLLQKIDDDLRFSDPKEAGKQARGAMKEVVALAELAPTLPHLEILCDVLGISASVDRVRARFTVAARALKVALCFARDHGLRASHARLLQRTCYLIGDQGEYQIAVELAKQATEHYVLLCQDTGIGKTLVDRAVMLHRSGLFEEAIRSYASSLEFLPEDSLKNRSAAFQGLGASHLILGDLNAAWTWTSKAIASQQEHSGQSWWRVIWLRGEIALKLELLEEAERAFGQVRNAFATRENVLDVAVISLRLAKTKFLQGHLSEVRKIAAEMMGLLKPLKRNKIASAVIQELACAVLTGEVTEVLLENAYLQIEKQGGRTSHCRKVTAAGLPHFIHSIIP